MKAFAVLTIWMAAFFSLPRAAAQEARAKMNGRVADNQGAVIPNAEVVVRSDDTGVEQTTETNGQGNWSVRFLTPGNYSFSVTVPRFKQVERHGIGLQTADQKQLNTTLDVGSTSSQVAVKGDAPLIDTTAATSGTVNARVVQTALKLSF